MQPYKGIHAQWMNISTPPPYRDSFFDAILRIGLQVPPHARVPLLLMSRRCDLVKHTGEARRRIRVRESRCTDAGCICPRYLWHVPPCCRAMLHAHWVRDGSSPACPTGTKQCTCSAWVASPASPPVATSQRRSTLRTIPRALHGSVRRNVRPGFLHSKVLTPAVSQGVSLALMGKNCCWGGKRESSAKIHFYPKSGSKIPICPPFLGLNQHDYIFAHLARIISQTVSAEVVLVRLSPSAHCR